MQAKGFGGLMIHARNGLLGGYLNRHWEETVRWILEEAKQRGLLIYLYDELHYPSGPAGGLLFETRPQSAMQYLELVLEKMIPPGEVIAGDYEKLLGVFPDGKVENLNVPWRNPEKTYVRILGFQIRKSLEYPDYLDAEDMKEFVRLSYRWYAERFGKYFGKIILGEFTDNSCANFGYYRRSIPWTAPLEQSFEKTAGLPLKQVLPSLFLPAGNSALHRILFWRFLSDLYLETFIRPIEEECARNGIAATGHYCIEDGTSEHVRQLGDRFDQKRHQQIPGMDMLGSHDWNELGKFPLGTPTPLAAPMTASPAYFMHGSRTLCECFGCSLEWGMTLAEMRRITGTLAVLGVDLFVPHGLYYSIAGHRKRECVPDFYHNTLWEFFDRWSVYTARICALSAFSVHCAETAIFYPATSQQASIELANPFPDHGERCNRMDDTGRYAAETLFTHGIGFEILDESLIIQAEISDGAFQIRLPNGLLHPIRTLILPSVWIVNRTTYDKLCAFSKAGGLLIAFGEKLSAVFDNPPAVQEIRLEKNFYVRHYEADPDEADFITLIRKNRKLSRITLEDTQGKIAVKEWIKDGHYFAMLHNFTRDRLENVRIQCAFSPASIDPDTLETARKHPSFTHTFEYGETLLLTEGGMEPEHITSSSPAEFSPVVREWKITLENPNTFRLKEGRCIFEKDARHWFYEFEIAEMPSALGIALDLEPTWTELQKGLHPFSGRYENTQFITRVKCLVNGKAVTGIGFGKHFDRWIYEGDISPLANPGRNRLELIQPHTLSDANAVPEPPMLFGNFGVCNSVLVAVPETLSRLQWNGTELASYSGAIRFSANVVLPDVLRGNELLLNFDDSREIAELFVDGVCCGVRVMPPWKFTVPKNLTRDAELKLSLRILNTPANRWK